MTTGAMIRLRATTAAAATASCGVDYECRQSDLRLSNLDVLARSESFPIEALWVFGCGTFSPRFSGVHHDSLRAPYGRGFSRATSKGDPVLSPDRVVTTRLALRSSVGSSRGDGPPFRNNQGPISCFCFCFFFFGHFLSERVAICSDGTARWFRSRNSSPGHLTTNSCSLDGFRRLGF